MKRGTPPGAQRGACFRFDGFLGPVVVWLLNVPKSLTWMVFLWFAQFAGVLAAGQELIGFAATAKPLLFLVLGFGLVVEGCGSLIGCTRCWRPALRLIGSTWRRSLQGRLSGCLQCYARAEAGFNRRTGRVVAPSFVSSCDSLSATRVESPSSRVQRVDAARHENFTLT